jgi:hypothetical protein
VEGKVCGRIVSSQVERLNKGQADSGRANLQRWRSAVSREQQPLKSVRIGTPICSVQSARKRSRGVAPMSRLSFYRSREEHEGENCERNAENAKRAIAGLLSSNLAGGATAGDAAPAA